MKSKIVLVLWCIINLCSKLAASIPFFEDSAQYLVGAQQTSALPSNVLENNAHSQLDNLVALSRSFNSDITYKSGIGSTQHQRESRIADQRGDTRWHALSRASGFPAVPQNLKPPAYFQEVPMPYSGGNMRPEMPLPQIPTGQSQVTRYQQNQRPLEAQMQLPYIRQNVDTLPFPRQTALRQAVEVQPNQLPFIKKPEAIRLPFIKGPVEAEAIQQHIRVPAGVVTVASTSKPLVQMNRQLTRQPIPPKPFVPFHVEPLERPTRKPSEQINNQPLFTKHVNNQEVPGVFNGQPQGLNTLQKMVTDNELKKIAEGQFRSRYTVVYPNGTIEYVNQIETIAKAYPNYSMINGYTSSASIAQPSEIQNNIGHEPSNVGQHYKLNEAQKLLNNNVINPNHQDKTQTQPQNNGAQIQAQNDVLKAAYASNRIEIMASAPDVEATERVSTPSLFDVEEITEDGTEGSNAASVIKLNQGEYMESQILSTSYPNPNLHTKTESLPQSTDVFEIKQSQDTEVCTKSNHVAEKEQDVIVHTEYNFSILKTPHQEQTESIFSAMDNADSEQQLIQTIQDQTQSSTGEPTVQRKRNEYIVKSEPVTQNFAETKFSITPTQARSAYDFAEYATNSQTLINNNQESSNKETVLVFDETNSNDSDDEEKSSGVSDFYVEASSTETWNNEGSNDVLDLTFINSNPNNEKHNKTQDLAFDGPKSTESGNIEASSEDSDLVFNRSYATEAFDQFNINDWVKKDILKDSDDIKVFADGENIEMNRNDRSTGFSIPTSQNGTRSQSNNSQVSNAESDEEAVPFTWFSTTDPNFLTKLLGNNFHSLVHFFMVPSKASAEADDTRV